MMQLKTTPFLPKNNYFWNDLPLNIKNEVSSLSGVHYVIFWGELVIN